MKFEKKNVRRTLPMGRKIRLFLGQRSKIIFVFFFPPLSPPALGISLRSSQKKKRRSSSIPTTTPTQHNTTQHHSSSTTAQHNSSIYLPVNPTKHASTTKARKAKAKATAGRKEGRSTALTTATTTTTADSMCPRPLQPAAPVTRLPTQHLPAASSPVSCTGRMIPKKSNPIMIGRPGISAQRARSSEAVPIGPPASEMVFSSPAPLGRLTRYRGSSYGRVPANEYCPRACYHCRQSFVPRGFGHEFCSGECQHSFTIQRHAEQRRLHMEKHQCY